MEKYGLVLEGGGLRGAYTAGALSWLYEQGITFDYHVGISSGAVYLSAFLLGDMENMYNAPVNYASDPEVVGIRALRREGYYVAYKYMFRHYLLEKGHFDVRPLIEKNPPMEIGAYSLKEGKTIWFEPKDMDPELDLIRASCALPIASEVIEYKGHRLLDGGITKMVPIERALEKGCTKCLVITTKPADYVRKPGSPILTWMMKRTYKECPQVAKDYTVRHLNYNKQMDIVNQMVKDGTGLLIRPSRTLKVSRFKGDPADLKDLFQLGYRDAQAMKDEIFAFMGKQKESSDH